MDKQLKPIPFFASEAAERAFWETHDSTEYVDWDNAQLVTLPNLRLTPEPETAEVLTAGAAVVAEQPA